jgi:hypothetical protein
MIKKALALAMVVGVFAAFGCNKGTDDAAAPATATTAAAPAATATTAAAPATTATAGTASTATTGG